jgi:uncharacterized protein (TIGR03435 family)
MLKLSVAAIALCLLAATSVLCQNQSTAPRLEFEVASVKPANPGDTNGGIKATPGGAGYVAENVPVRLMIMLMFDLHTSQLIGGPSWINTELYDVEAKADGPHTIDELHVMFQNLLIDRFNLQFHKETRNLPAYELVVDKSGPKMTENPTPPTFDIPINFTGAGQVVGVRVPMYYLAWNLSRLVGRPVIDETGLTKNYDFKLQFTPEPPPGAAGRSGGDGLAANPPPVATGPDLFTALREQLGLRLETRKGPVEVMVIDHIDRPSPN